MAAALLALFFFAPRFVYWRARETTITTAEVARARAALRQLENPFVRFDDHTNRFVFQSMTSKAGQLHYKGDG